MRRLGFRAFGRVLKVGGGSPPALFKATGEHNVYEAMERQRRKVLAGDAAAVARTLGAWKVAQAAIQKDLDALAAKIAAAQAAGVAFSPSWLHNQERYQALLTTIGERVAAYSSVAGANAAAMQKAGFKQGALDAEELVAVAAGVKTGFQALNAGAFEGLVGLLTDKSPLHDLFKAMGPDAVGKARTVFAAGMAKGSHPDAIAKGLMKELGATKDRSLLIARTESARAYTTAQRMSYEANADVVEGSRWVSARDARTCALCWAKDGTVVPHGVKWGTHPGCRCALAPIVKFFDDPQRTGEEVLAEREAAQPGYAKEILGPARYGFWKGGQIALPDLVEDVDHPRWGRGVRARNIAEIDADVKAGKAGNALPKLANASGVLAGSAPKPDLLAPNPKAVPKHVPPAPAPAPASAPPPVPKAPAPSAAQTAAQLAQSLPKPTNLKYPTDFIIKLVKAQGANLTPDQASAVVKHWFPATKTTAASILHHYQKQGVTPLGGFPAGHAPAPAAKAPVAKAPPPVAKAAPAPAAPPAPPVPPPAPAPPPTAAQVILHRQTGGQGGSNPGGFYLGSDGVQRYVKFYADPRQAHGEHLANEVYRALGIEAPRSVVFDHDGQTAYASEILPSTGTVGKLGLTKDLADRILAGFAADVLTGNWDAVGTGLDNVVVLPGGGVARIDQGGAFLFRAKNGLKPDHVLTDIPEWAGFAPGGVNPDYAKVFSAAGIKKAESLGKDLKAQIDAVAALRAKVGGWKAFVDSTAPHLDALSRQRIADMMEARTDLLQAKAAALGAKKPKAAAKPKAAPGVVGVGVDPASLKAKAIDNAEGASMRKRLYGKVFPTFTVDQTSALASYKGNGYKSMNLFMRGITKTLGPSGKSKIVRIKEMFRAVPGLDEDIVLKRGFGFDGYHGLMPNQDEGQILQDHSFLSMSTDETTSRNFAYGPYSGDPDHPVLFFIRIPKGTKMIPAKTPNGSDWEHEFIMDHANYRVESVRKEWVTNWKGKRVELTILDVDLIESQEGETHWNRKIE